MGILVGLVAGTGAGVWYLLNDELGEPEESVESGASKGELVMDVSVNDLFKGINDFSEGFTVV